MHIIRAAPGDDFAVIVEIEGLQKIYDGKQRVVAVDGIDLNVHEGELFGLLGPNGAGKTTTISICTTRALPTAGRVRIAGIDVVKTPALARRCIGVVPQYNTLDRACTIFENIHFHCLYFGFSRAEAKQRTNQLLSAVSSHPNERRLIPRSSRAASRSGCRLHVRSRIGRRSYFWMSRARGLIRRAASRCGRRCADCAKRESPSC